MLDVLHGATLTDFRGVASTVFLLLVDVKKSRQECEDFVNAETKREAFGDSSSQRHGTPRILE